MKLVIAIIVLLAVTHSKRNCIKPCFKNFDFHCGCKSENFESCRNFENRCLFEIANCTSRGEYVFVFRGKCDLLLGDPVAPKCHRFCPIKYDPHCACKAKSFVTCSNFPNRCYFERYNCTSQDYVTVIKGECPENSGI